MPDADYAIVGGGPAGLAVAIEAAVAGKRAVVVERCRGPVDKACGEGLMPPGVARLRALGVEPPAWGCHPFTGIRYVDGDVIAEANFPEGPGLGVRRLALSEAMLARAQALGVTLLQGTEAMGWAQDAEGVTLETSQGPVRARWLVAADGLHSRVRKEAGIEATPPSLKGRRLGIRRHFHGAPWSDKVEVWWGDGVEAYVTPVGPERVGVAFLWSGGKGDHEGFLARFPALAARLGPPESTVRGAGPFGVRVSRRTSGRVLLVGDAGGYLDALTGEGLSLAFECAEALVAATIAGAPAAAGPRYEADWTRITRRHLFFTGLMLQVAKRPWLRRRVVRALRRFPSGMAGFLAVNTGHWGPVRALPAVGAVGIGLLTG